MSLYRPRGPHKARKRLICSALLQVQHLHGDLHVVCAPFTALGQPRPTTTFLAGLWQPMPPWGTSRLEVTVLSCKVLTQL